ncbi:MAG: hypothetical protein HZB68_03765, partial [Candidatus Aenigmarchaeota archaeon]|nr:hypothetical protein [Candidatus Aenigmarchaeota archaeon]
MSKEFVYNLGKEPDEEGLSGKIKVKVKGGVFKPKIEDYSFSIKEGDEKHSKTMSFDRISFLTILEDSWVMDEDAMLGKMGAKAGMVRKENGVYVTKVTNSAEMELNDNGSLKKISMTLEDESEGITARRKYCTLESVNDGKWRVT